MRKKSTVAQKTYCPGKKVEIRGLEISNGEMSHLHYDHCNGVQYSIFGISRIARKPHFMGIPIGSIAVTNVMSVTGIGEESNR